MREELHFRKFIRITSARRYTPPSTLHLQAGDSRGDIPTELIVRDQVEDERGTYI